ncbi:MAG: cupredoxin domain-containing protein [Phycisphaeraceae bacterium]
MRQRSFALLMTVTVAAAVMFAVAGCGGGDDDGNTTTSTPTTTTAPAGGGGKATKLDISADPDGALSFDTDKLTAKAGKVTIDMANPSSVPHTVSIEGNGVDEEGTGGTAGVGEGKVSTVTADLEAGKYTFYCPVDAHEQAGMKGTLTVE